jgi:Skp family chaperone for outer membrane proteins
MKKLLLSSFIFLVSCESSAVPSNCKEFCYQDFKACFQESQDYGMTRMDCLLLKEDCALECKGQVVK